MPREIVIEIGEDGSIELRAEGFKGKDCEEKTKFIEEALGLAGWKRKKLPEYYATEVVKQKQRA